MHKFHCVTLDPPPKNKNKNKKTKRLYRTHKSHNLCVCKICINYRTLPDFQHISIVKSFAIRLLVGWLDFTAYQSL